MAIDDGHAIHYTAVEPGTAVYAADEARVGTVRQIVDNYREHILDGIVIELEDGAVVFADGPEVARTAERGVTLAIPSSAVANLGPPESGPGRFKPNVKAGRLGRLLGGNWRRD